LPADGEPHDAKPPIGAALIGTLGWPALPRAGACAVARGRDLRDYAAIFGAVEVNTTFYRTPTAPTFARWAERTPPGFRFALNLPEAICRQLPHGLAEDALHRFLDCAQQLGGKVALVVVHLPPQLFFSPLAERALALLKAKVPIQLVCEPHDPSWQSPAADHFLSSCRIPRVGVVEGAGLCGRRPGGWRELEYLRVRKLPRRDDPTILERLQDAASAGTGERWWIFEKEAGDLAASLAAWSCAGDLRPPLNREAS
jgi:uncharacterized protein YecE (DUF72 family)